VNKRKGGSEKNHPCFPTKGVPLSSFNFPSYGERCSTVKGTVQIYFRGSFGGSFLRNLMGIEAEKKRVYPLDQETPPSVGKAILEDFS